MIKFTLTGWTNNKTGLNWIQHFDKHIKGRAIGAYWMLIINNHKSHMSAEFNEYYKENKIVIIYMPTHSSYIL